MPVYREQPEERLNQGDVFADVPFIVPQGDERHERVMPGMVISHDCECDKFFEQRATAHDPDMWCVAMVPLYPLSELKGGQDGDARKGRIRRWFYLPAEGDHEETVGDFWLEQPIPIVQLLERERVSSMSPEYVKRLHIQIWELRTRIAAADAFKGSHAP